MLAKLYAAVLKFVLSKLLAKSFAGVPSAVAAHVNLSALAFVAFPAWQSGGGVLGVESALLAHVSDYVAPPDVTMVAAGLVLLFEIQKRLGYKAPATNLKLS